MEHSEEDIAHDLHREMLRRFGGLSPTMEGAGIHWHCTIDGDERSCRINGITLRTVREYLTAFRHESATVAWSRTPSRDDTLDAVADWLNGVHLSALYENFPFVDAMKRKLALIRDQALDAEPRLRESVESELVQNAGDIYSLSFRGGDRSCKLSFYGKNKSPDARFSWEKCQLFEYQPEDVRQLAAVLHCWLCDKFQPSQMRSEFPWLTIGDLADYYEAGRPVEGEFIKSWDRMEEFYDDVRFPFADDVKPFLAAMRSRGYDKTLRAGHSLWSLVVSRSRRHGMRGDRPSLQFRFCRDGMEVFNYIEDRRNGTRTAYSEIEFNPEIDALLTQLESAAIE